MPLNTFSKQKQKKKVRCEVGFLGKNCETSSKQPVRLFGDMAFVNERDREDLATEANLGLGLFNLTKMVSAFEADHRLKRVNVYYHPFSEFQAADRQNLYEELSKTNMSSAQQEMLQACQSSEQFLKEHPDILSKIPTFRDEKPWADVLRSGKAPFDSIIDPDKSHATIIWELIKTDFGHDMIVKAINISFRLANECGYSWEDLIKVIQKVGVPSVWPFGEYFTRIACCYKILLSILRAGANGDTSFRATAMREGTLANKDGTSRECSTSYYIRLFNYNGQIFFYFSTEFLNKNGPKASLPSVGIPKGVGADGENHGNNNKAVHSPSTADYKSPHIINVSPPNIEEPPMRKLLKETNE